MAPKGCLRFRKGGTALQMMEESHLTSRNLEHLALALQAVICWVVEAVGDYSTPTSSAKSVRPLMRV